MTLGELLTLLSYLTGAAVFVWAARRRRLATEGMTILAAIGFVSGILGAKLTQTLASGLPLVAMANPGGRALLGGLVFGWLGVEIAKGRMGIRRSTGDLFALALPAGEAIGRLGCHFNGCCYGVPWNGPGAVWQHGTSRFPSQLVSAAVAAAMFGVLLWLSSPSSFFRGDDASNQIASYREKNEEGAGGWRHKAGLREGDLFRFYLLLFGITRFGLEFARWRESIVAGLSPMQWFCLDLIVIASIGLLRRKRDDLPQLRPGV
jgi:phosphatidylglycerol:prolipoprotein diacylglycerol transferase